MNVIQAIQDYITKMITNISGMKVLLLDKDTVGIVSLVYSRSQILQKEVFLHEKLDAKNREFMPHLKAVCFLRPTMDNLALLQNELKEPKYGEYHIFFSNNVKNSFIEELAEYDTHEVVQELQEFFGDYYAINTDLFSLNIDTAVSVHQSDWRQVLIRTVDGLASILLSLKKQPLIRYSGKSGLAQKVVTELSNRISQEPGLFDFKKIDTPPLLLVLDRVDDPVTPLLSQWTYQAMVHEVFGIQNNRVILKKFVPNIKKDLEEIMLSSEQDPWFKQTMYSNFGELGVKIKELVDEYQSKSSNNANIESIDDIKRFVEQFPEFKKMAGNVAKHVTLVSELSRVIDERSLLEVSEVEQEIANNHAHNEHSEAIRNLMNNPKIKPDDILRVVMLYALRYESGATNLRNFTERLQQLGVDRDKISLIQTLVQHAGSANRTGDLFNSKNILKRGIMNFKRGLKGVQNIYTEHKPLLKQTLELISKNQLKEVEYPFLSGGLTRDPPQDVIVFIIGGVTFEEALMVHQLNTSGSMRVILGGTSIHNAKSFLKDLQEVERTHLS